MNLYKGYDADGTKLSGVQKSENMAFASPAFLASMYTNNYSESEIKQNYAHIMDDNNLRKYDVGLKDESKPFVAYYGESVRLINMIAYSGNWINP